MSIIGQLPKFKAKQGEVWKRFATTFNLRTKTSRLDIFEVVDQKLTFLGCLEDGAARAHTLVGRAPLHLYKLSPWTHTYPRSGTSLTLLKNLTWVWWSLRDSNKQQICPSPLTMPGKLLHSIKQCQKWERVNLSSWKDRWQEGFTIPMWKWKSSKPTSRMKLSFSRWW